MVRCRNPHCKYEAYNLANWDAAAGQEPLVVGLRHYCCANCSDRVGFRRWLYDDRRHGLRCQLIRSDGVTLEAAEVGWSPDAQGRAGDPQPLAFVPEAGVAGVPLDPHHVLIAESAALFGAEEADTRASSHVGALGMMTAKALAAQKQPWRRGVTQVK